MFVTRPAVAGTRWATWVPGDYIGGTSLTRQRMMTGVVALTDTTIVSVHRDAMNTVVQQDHRLARQIGEAIEMRRRPPVTRWPSSGGRSTASS